MKVALTYSGAVAPATEGEAAVYTPTGGQCFTLNALDVVYGVNVDFDLELSLYHGTRQVVPISGVIKGGTGHLPVKAEWTWTSDESIRVHYKNTHASNTYSFTVILQGELE